MAGQSNPDGDKNSNALLWGMALLCAIGFVLWWQFSEYFKVFFLALKRYEAIGVSFFTDKINRWIDWTIQADPEYDLTMHAAQQLSTAVGTYYVYPVSIILLILAIIIFKGHIGMRFNKIYNMDRLMQQEKENWPQISPVVDLDLMEMDIQAGPWAMSMNPMQFCRHYKLLELELIPDRKAAWRAEGVVKATVLKDKTTEVFTNQLGPLWQGVDKLPPHVKAIYAVFLARAEHDQDAAIAYLNILARGAAKGVMDYSLTESYIKKYGKCRAAQRCLQRHAYIVTVMASMLELARTDGVLASADFLWLKPVDRKLWYMLNNVGRQVAVPEIAGAFAHWIAEKQMARPLSVPMVDEATRALELAVSNTVYIPEDDEEIPVASAE